MMRGIDDDLQNVQEIDRDDLRDVQEIARDDLQDGTWHEDRIF